MHRTPGTDAQNTTWQALLFQPLDAAGQDVTGRAVRALSTELSSWTGDGPNVAGTKRMLGSFSGCFPFQPIHSGDLG